MTAARRVSDRCRWLIIPSLRCPANFKH